MKNHAVAIGSKVRSYDFRGDKSCFVEGIVTELREFDMTIRATREVFDNQEFSTTRTVMTHTEVFPGWEDRIEIL